ncbi:hypothetical protein [Lacrimispora brassicae]
MDSFSINVDVDTMISVLEDCKKHGHKIVELSFYPSEDFEGEVLPNRIVFGVYLPWGGYCCDYGDVDEVDEGAFSDWMNEIDNNDVR